MAPRTSNKQTGNEELIMEPQDRTVTGYGSVEEIKKALSEFDLSGKQDWVHQDFDKETTIESPNDVDNEVDRLKVLKSYGILDTEKESEFEEITKEAKAFFDCPIALVSLVDMGRQWFKSAQGLPVESTPRCLAFCSHVVKRKERYGVMVVPDATQDSRFKDNALVTDDPKIRFYAGAPLITPEGAKVGSLCVIDVKPRPEGLTRAEEDRLTMLGQEVVYNMVVRDN